MAVFATCATGHGHQSAPTDLRSHGPAEGEALVAASLLDALFGLGSQRVSSSSLTPAMKATHSA